MKRLNNQTELMHVSQMIRFLTHEDDPRYRVHPEHVWRDKTASFWGPHRHPSDPQVATPLHETIKKLRSKEFQDWCNTVRAELPVIEHDLPPGLKMVPLYYGKEKVWKEESFASTEALLKEKDRVHAAFKKEEAEKAEAENATVSRKVVYREEASDAPFVIPKAKKGAITAPKEAPATTSGSTAAKKSQPPPKLPPARAEGRPAGAAQGVTAKRPSSGPDVQVLPPPSTTQLQTQVEQLRHQLNSVQSQLKEQERRTQEQMEQQHQEMERRHAQLGRQLQDLSRRYSESEEHRTQDLQSYRKDSQEIRSKIRRVENDMEKYMVRCPYARK